MLPVAVLAVACGREKKQATALSEDLQSDLKLASSSLAYPDLKVISPDEQAPSSAPKRAGGAKQSPAKRMVQHTKVNPPEPTSETVDMVASAPEPATEDPQPSPAAEPVIATPRPAPVPVQYPTERGGGMGTAGTIISVILRGGSAGEDHCEIRDPRRGRGGILINNRVPMGGPVFGGGQIPINPLGGGYSAPRIR
jgi:hypothetical protein